MQKSQNGFMPNSGISMTFLCFCFIAFTFLSINLNWLVGEEGQYCMEAYQHHNSEMIETECTNIS